MRPKFKQYGLLQEFDSVEPADYRHTVDNPLNQQARRLVVQAGLSGSTSKELAVQTGRTEKSMAGRLTELHNAGVLLLTGAKRDGCGIYIATEERESR